MLITRLYLYLSTLFLWTTQKTHGAKRHCGIREPVVNICSNSKALLTPNVFIETNSVPENQNTLCLCTISPSKSRVTVLMTYRMAPDRGNDFNMEFRLNDAVLNKTIMRGKTTFSGKTELISTTKKPHTNDRGVCLLLDTATSFPTTADASSFNITCEANVIITTQSVTITSALERGVTSVSTLAELVTNRFSTVGEVPIKDSSKTGGSDNDSIPIAPVVGGAVGGVVCIALVIIIVVLCRRRKGSNKHKGAKATSNTDTGENMKSLKAEDFDMTENPLYNMQDSANVQLNPGNERKNADGR